MEYKISTRTVIASINVEFKIHDIYESLPALTLDDRYQQQYLALLPVKKRRGRRKKTEDSLSILKTELDSLISLKAGDIVAVYFRNNKKGLPQYLKYGAKFFRNALNIVMMIQPTKRINLKLSQNGKIQMTGCKHEDDAKQCLKYLFKHLYANCRDSIVPKHDKANKQLEICYFTVMTNLDFNIGFHINRQKLNNLVNGKTVFNSLLETSFGYTGVNIKIEVPYDPEIGIDRIILDKQPSSWDWNESKLDYEEYLKTGGESYFQTEKHKRRYNTFLVFHSGNIIMSGMRLDKMIEHFKDFCEFLKSHRDEIEEHLA